AWTRARVARRYLRKPTRKSRSTRRCIPRIFTLTPSPSAFGRRLTRSRLAAGSAEHGPREKQDRQTERAQDIRREREAFSRSGEEAATRVAQREASIRF